MHYISLAQVVLSIILIILILLQERESGLSGVFGGSQAGAYQTRRGFERLIFWGTIIVAIAFAVLSLINLIK